MDKGQLTIDNAPVHSPMDSVPPGYKLTEVGVIPEDWETAKLGDLIDYTKGYAFKSSEYASDGFRIIRVSDTTYDSILEVNPVFVATTKAPLYTKWALRENDLVISTVGSKPPMYDSMVGKVILVQRRYRGALLNQNAVLIRDKKRRAHFQRILLDHFRLKRYLAFIESIYRGNANQASITLKELFQFCLPLPVVEAEQRAIAETLSDVDELIRTLEKLIAKKRAIKQAARQQLLTGKTRLPGFGGEWETVHVRDIANVKTGPFGSALHERDYVDEGTPIITVEHLGEFGVIHSNLPQVSDSDRKRLNSYSLQVGDIVFSRVGSIDRNALIRPAEDGWLFSGRLLRVRPERMHVSSPYLSYHFHSEQFKVRVREVAVGQTMASLNTRILQSIEISLPSLPEQVAIATVLSDMDAEIAALEQRLDKTRQIKQGMMQQLLTGKVRLV